MSFGSVSVATVSVFGATKSVGSVTVCAVAVVTVSGTSGTVDGATDADGATTGFGFFLQAGMTTAARRASVTANDLNDLLIYFSSFRMIAAEWPVASGQWSGVLILLSFLTTEHWPLTTRPQSPFFDQS